MPILSDGTVISNLLSMVQVGVSTDMGIQDSVALRKGVVTEVIYPSDTVRSVSKKYVEYRVAVSQRDAGKPGATVDYPNCLVMGLVGTPGDTFRYTLRIGSSVMLLCLDGQMSRAYIIGAERVDLVKDAEADGHNLYFEFNGISVGIDKDGQLKLQFAGATDNDGELTGADNGPTTLEITKDGSVELYTKDRNQLMKLNHTDKKAEFAFDTEWNVKVNGDVKENYGKSWTLEAGSTIALKSGKAMTIDTGAALTLTVGGAMVVKPSDGMKVGAATDAMMKGTSYRKAQQALNNKLKGSLSAMQAKLDAAGSALMSLLPPAGIAISAAASAAGDMASAIGDFESKAAEFLSEKNKSD